MNDSAILAKQFVPSRLKSVNCALPNHNIFAPVIPTLVEDIRELQRKLQPLSECKCSSSKHNLSAPFVVLNLEATFALASQGPSTTSEPKHDEIKSVDNVSNIHEYLHTFKALLQLERHEVLRLFERYSQYAVRIRAKSAFQARILAPGIANAKPSIYAGDIALIRPLRNVSLRMPNGEWSDPVFALQFHAMVVDVTRKNKGTIEVTWIPTELQNDMMQAYPENSYNVRIIPATTLHERCLTALAWLSTVPEDVTNNLLLPNEAPAVPVFDDDRLRMEHLSKLLNYQQRLFVRLVQTRTLRPSTGPIRTPMILTGPAGTGKTQALLISIFEVLKLSSTNRVLVCTPSHTAADVVTRRLAERLNRDELWRLLDSNRPVNTVPAVILPFTRQRIDTGAFRLPSTVEELFKFRVIVCTCSDASILYSLGFTNQQLRIQRQCFVTYSQETCRNLNVKVGEIPEGVLVPHFTHLFIDEASQATEPETLIPLSVVVDHEPNMIKAEIALVGDPRQLSPTVYSQVASDAGLERSYMERLLQRPMHYLSGGWPFMLGPESDYDLPFDLQHRRSAVFLTVNYRGHASFLMMPSSLFYFDKLEVVDGHSATDWISKLRCVEALSKPATELALKWNQCSAPSNSAPSWNACEPEILRFRRQETWPIHFRGVVGHDTAVAIEAFAGSDCWCNLQEAETVFEIVSALVANGVKTSSIGIMSPFRGQVTLIRKLLRAANLNGVDVGTIEDYQAVERDVIVLSLTRADKMFVANDVAGRAGVFNQVKRTNVSLTRAEHLFIVVGNPNLMVQDLIWRQWLWFCLRNGVWYGEQVDHTWFDEMQVKPITLKPFRSGETHALLAASINQMENLVLMSSMERNRRFL